MKPTLGVVLHALILFSLGKVVHMRCYKIPLFYPITLLVT
jgi:hypothetical protein